MVFDVHFIWLTYTSNEQCESSLNGSNCLAEKIIICSNSMPNSASTTLQPDSIGQIGSKIRHIFSWFFSLCILYSLFQSHSIRAKHFLDNRIKCVLNSDGTFWTLLKAVCQFLFTKEDVPEKPANLLFSTLESIFQCTLTETDCIFLSFSNMYILVQCK